MCTTVDQHQYFVEHHDNVVPNYFAIEYNKRYFI